MHAEKKWPIGRRLHWHLICTPIVPWPCTSPSAPPVAMRRCATRPTVNAEPSFSSASNCPVACSQDICAKLQIETREQKDRIQARQAVAPSHRPAAGVPLTTASLLRLPRSAASTYLLPAGASPLLSLGLSLLCFLTSPSTPTTFSRIARIHLYVTLL